MKKVLAALLVLALVAPAMADVNVTASDAGDGKLLISFTTSGDPAPVVRGMALTLSITGGNVASEAAFLGSDFNTFIDYAYSNPSGYTVGAGHPLAITGSAGVLASFPATDLAVSVGYLDEGGNQAGLTSGKVVELQLSGISGCATVAISANSVRGGAVVGDNLGTVTVQASQDVCLAPTHTVSTPNAPTGTALGFITLSNTYTTGGSVDSEGHAVQYQFDWGDGTTSAWAASTSASKTWNVGGTYAVKARARCSVDNNIVSDWSAPLSVVIQECQFYNLTKKITTFAPTGTDNVVNATDVSKIITYINSYKVSTAVWAVVPTNPNYMAGFNLSTAAAAINASDVSALINYINAKKVSSSVWVANCTSLP